MKLNLENLKKYIKTATLNYTCCFLNIQFTKDKVVTNILSDKRVIVSNINMENNILLDLKDGESYEWNWIEPNQSVMPYLQLFDDEIVECKISQDSIHLKSGNLKTKIALSEKQSQYISPVTPDTKKFEFFHTLKADETFIQIYSKIKKISSRANAKIYFTVEDNAFYIESTDKTNSSSNNVRFKLSDLDSDVDFFLCYDYKYISSLMSTLENLSDDEFTLSFTFVHAQKLGLISVTNKEKTINFYVCSTKDL